MGERVQPLGAECGRGWGVGLRGLVGSRGSWHTAEEGALLGRDERLWKSAHVIHRPSGVGVLGTQLLDVRRQPAEKDYHRVVVGACLFLNIVVVPLRYFVSRVVETVLQIQKEADASSLPGRSPRRVPEDRSSAGRWRAPW